MGVRFVSWGRDLLKEREKGRESMAWSLWVMGAFGWRFSGRLQGGEFGMMKQNPTCVSRRKTSWHESGWHGFAGAWLVGFGRRRQIDRRLWELGRGRKIPRSRFGHQAGCGAQLCKTRIIAQWPGSTGLDAWRRSVV